MKKLFAALLAACMVLTLAACGETAPEKETTGETATSVNTTAATVTEAPETAAPEQKTTEATAEAPTQVPAEQTPAETVPDPTNEPWEEEEEEAVPPETLPAGAHITLSGAPTMGTANGNTYENASAHLQITIPDRYSFVSEASMLELNEVANAAELAGKDIIHITSDFLDIIRVWALKLGGSAVGGSTTTEAAFSAAVEQESRKLEANGATVEDEPCFVSFTAGDAIASRVVATAGTEITTYLFTGYQVGDYLVVVMVNDFYGDAVEDLLAGIDIA